MNELSRRGIVDSLAEARAIARDNTIGYGLSLDLDAFDPAEAPGVGTPAPGGIHANDFLETWIDLTGDPACRGMEIVEYNPHRDQQGRTLRLMETFVAAAIQEERMQWAG
jgi:arginase